MAFAHPCTEYLSLNDIIIIQYNNRRRLTILLFIIIITIDMPIHLHVIWHFYIFVGETNLSHARNVKFGTKWNTLKNAAPRINAINVYFTI